MSKNEENKELHCVFTFQGVLQKIFKYKPDAELFKKVYCPAGYIRPYTLENSFDAVIVSRENSKC